MPRTKITKRFVENLTPPKEGNTVYWDTELTGFGVRITAQGARAFVFRYVHHRRERRYTIGKFPGVQVAAARKQVDKLNGMIADGKDPLAMRVALRDAPTVKQLTEEYVKRHAEPHKRPKSVAEDKAMIKKYILPAVGNHKVAAVCQRDIENLHQKLKKTPYRANRILALLSKMFGLAVAWEWIERNPVRAVKKYPEEKRDRWLRPEELQRVVAALDVCPTKKSANAIRLLLLTGARRGEVLSMTWSQIDFERGVWTKPSAHTKQKRTEKIPLSQSAIELLKAMKEKADPDTALVFPSPKDKSPMREVGKTWKWVAKKAGVEDVRLHDLRHTYASYLVSNGRTLEEVGRLLGHTQAQTTLRYAHFADDPLRKATETMGSLVKNLTPANAA